MSHSAASLLYFGTASGQLYRLSNAATASAGNTPIRIDTGANFPSGAYVSSIAVHPNNDQSLLVTFSNYNVVNIFHSPNGGATWTAIEGNLGGSHSPSFRSVAWMPAEAVDYCFVATSTGIYSTTLLDGATTVWRQEAAESRRPPRRFPRLWVVPVEIGDPIRLYPSPASLGKGE